MDKELNIKGLNMHTFRLIAVLIMLFSLSTTSYAALDGEGTEIKPYIIDEPSDFDVLRDIIKNKKPGKYLYVKQTEDIDLTEVSKRSGQPVFPLVGMTIKGGRLQPLTTMGYFYGRYDGGGHTISNWNLLKSIMPNPVPSTTKLYYISMFGPVGKSGGDKSYITNLNIEGFDLELPNTQSTNSTIGFAFIASVSVNTEISNCHVKKSSAHGAGHFSFGPIACKNEGEILNCTVSNCKYLPTGKAQSIGGICGINLGNVQNCFADSVILNGDSYIGGLVGEQNNGRVENCGFNGTFVNNANTDVINSGGLCGKVNKGEFYNCFSSFDNGGVSWKSARMCGGLIGTVDKNAEITVKNCYSFPRIKIGGTQNEVDLFVGYDEFKNDSKRVYESLYCYENAFGSGFKPVYKNTSDFSDSYKEDHKLTTSTQDFMRSGCFAEVLSDYHIVNLTGENPWREDIEFLNDTLPVLRFMVDDSYDVEPFCHPGIYTLGHKETDNISKINGQLKYITDDQTTEGWLYGFEVKVGDGEWTRISDWTATLKVNAIDFFYEYEFNKKKTIAYRAYTYNPIDPTRVAYGKIDTICVGSTTGPETIEGCDSLNYDGRWFYLADNGMSYTNSENEEVIIKIGETRRFTKPVLEGECDAKTVVSGGITYDKSGVYETSFKNETGCKTYNTQEVILYPTLPAKDSLKVFSLGEMSYTYEPKGGIEPQTVSVSSEYVLEPKQLVIDQIPYAKKRTCDSATIIVKYVIPIKVTKTEDLAWSCKPVVYNGKEYTKDTVISDTLKTPDPSVAGGMLYEIRTRHIKAAVPDTILKTQTHCGVIKYECPQGICEKDEPFFDTVPSITTIAGSQCPTDVTITHHVIGEKPTREENIVSCGPYNYVYKGKTTVWKKSGDYQVTRSGINVGACDNDTTVTYHLTIGESTSYNDTTVHGCGKVVFKTLSGDTKIFTETTDYVDEVSSSAGCSSERTVHVYIHKSENKSSVLPVTGCAPYSFVKLNGEEVVYEAGTHTIKDTLKSTDACGCDSIVKTTILTVQNPTTLSEIVENGCNEVVIEGKTYTKDTSFVVEKLDPNILKVCRTQYQPYTVNITSSIVETFHIDTCGSFEKNGQKLKASGKIEIKTPSATGCENKQIYDVRIIEPTNIDSVVYACESYQHDFYDGHQETIEDDGTVLIDKIQSKVCLCDSIIRKVTVHISNDSHEVLPPVENCGPYEYVKKSNGKKILIESTQIVKDTLVTKYGCHVYYETEVNIIPVQTTIEKLDACKEYNSVVPVWNYNNLPVNVIVNTPDVQEAELVFLKANELHPVCMDTTKLFLTVHGVGAIAAEPVVECDTFIYTDYDGSKRIITESAVIVDTLKSKVCDCDSVILTTNVTINKSVPVEMRKTNSLRSCDSVVYVNSKGVEKTFKENISFLDTFQMKNTGCDSIVIVDVTVPKSTGSVTILSACGDTTLYDELNGNYPHVFEESGIWRQVLSQNAEGCNNFKEWHVNITPTPRDTVFETGCGELSFRGDTYTSENEKASSFSLVVNGDTKCDTIHNYYLTVYPKYNSTEEYESCDSVVRNGVVYKHSILFRDTLMSRNNCDSIINVNIVVNQSQDVTKYEFGCNEVTFIDEDYNGGVPVKVYQDTTILIEKQTVKGCPYLYTQQIQVGYPSDSVTEIYECLDTKLGYVSYLDLQLYSDTIIYDTIPSDNRCGTVVQHVVHVEKCFPYPVLVNKYNWILVCNDVIFDNDKFKLKSNVKYNWYKDERLVLTTSESYYTEDEELDGCYQVGIVIEDGSEYLSDIVCIDENHGYTISPQPNPVDKLQPVTIVCDFPVEGVIGTEVEVFNMNAEKVYFSKATSAEIVIPGMSVSGYYLVRLTTVSGKVLTAKYVVK